MRRKASGRWLLLDRMTKLGVRTPGEGASTYRKGVLMLGRYVSTDMTHACRSDQMRLPMLVGWIDCLIALHYASTFFYAIPGL